MGLESAFAWIGQIAEWIGQWFPRWEIIDTTEGWIKWVGGSKVKTGGAGIVWYWPARTKFRKHYTARDSINCKAQTVTLLSGETVLIESAVIYEIKDLAKLAGETADPLITIEDLTMGAVMSVMETYPSWEDVLKASIRAPRARDTEFNRSMREAVQAALLAYGVQVLAVLFQNKAKTRVLKLVNSQE